MADDKVVFLAFDNPNLEPDTITLYGCGQCRNKTFNVREDGGEFPVMRCAACNAEIGRIGWAEQEA